MKRGRSTISCGEAHSIALRRSIRRAFLYWVNNEVLSLFSFDLPELVQAPEHSTHPRIRRVTNMHHAQPNFPYELISFVTRRKEPRGNTRGTERLLGGDGTG